MTTVTDIHTNTPATGASPRQPTRSRALARPKPVKLKITSRSVGAIRHVGNVARPVDPDAIAKALGAQIVSQENVHGTPISLHALRRELESRVRSTGGRPALEGATKIQKIPLRTALDRRRSARRFCADHFDPD